MEYLFRFRSRRSQLGRYANVLGAVLLSTLAVACGGKIDAESSASNLDAASSNVLPAEASADDSDVPAVGADANGSGDDASGEGGTLIGRTGNLIVNPSCEDGTVGWTTLSGSPLASSSTYVHTGDTASCRAYDRMDVTNSAAGLSSYDGPAQDITSVVAPGHSYTVSAWALWAPPPSAEAGPLGDAADASTASYDGAAGSDASVDAEAAASLGPQSVYIDAKVECTPNGGVMYDRVAIASAIPEATWTPVQDSTLLMVPTGCSVIDVELYVEGPDIGLDLYVDEVTLLFVQ